MSNLLVYGSYGYTGRLIVATAMERGIEPVLAGRNLSELEAQASEWGLTYRTFDLERPEIIKQQLSPVDVVLNCAGPFVHTHEPLLDACLETDTHYLDITGEIEVFESIAARDEQATDAGVTALPGVGFDVVPSDCLAVHLQNAVSNPSKLTLGFESLGTPSPGTALTMIDGMLSGGAVRRDGKIRPVPAGWNTRTIDFGSGERTAITIPWGDVSTAYHSTGIPNIEFYMAAPPWSIRGLRLTRRLGPVLETPPIRRGLESLAKRLIGGPSAEQRQHGETRLWGEVTDEESGETRIARLKTPNGYALTAKTAVESVVRTLNGEPEPGFQTPATAFGPEYVLEFDDVVRRDAMAPPSTQVQ
ncbi:saccharopine dehydrogenase family protein [Halocatena pleomorpha]|uniref:Saccharopine dehydrogenase n=1 Tax=Halocatena pleomorpha TaxID=1785090 RepID=A0A3P3RD66_9EURY|nr:saccharopine dehydrogenase NADP-binding domain-containing protein [Halocatena pleomorpha]RRJ30888.1 saccharopine dehydrogenase [Halocatena pleomorpha]